VAPTTLIVPREQKRYERRLKKATSARIDNPLRSPDGTVGAVAIDREGNLAAATSTGGTLFKPVGRVGDSPLPGCGYYADNQSAAVSSTGHGESIIRIQLARTAADFAARLTNQSPQPGFYFAAAQAAIRVLTDRVKGHGGLIMIDHAGRVGFAYNTPHLARAFMMAGMSTPEVGI
jgi:beta-aspartyl-peptidase (threonine type)